VNYPNERLKFKGAIIRKIFNVTDSSSSNSSHEDKMIAQLKEKFHITGRKSERIQILMVLP
jgi:hypothetical protein